MKIVITTFDRKPPYVHETLRALFRNGNMLELGTSNQLDLLVTEKHSNTFFDALPECFRDNPTDDGGCYGTCIHFLTDAQVQERNRLSPRKRTKFATRLALEMGADIVLQDDLDFAPDFWPRFNALLPIDTSKLLVSLYYPRPAKAGVGLCQWYARDYYGMQAMFFGEDARKVAIEYLKDPREEADDNALARMLTKRQDILLYACVPSLVQHVGVVSSLKSRGHRAPTFGLTIEECHKWLNTGRQPIRWPGKGGR